MLTALSPATEELGLYSIILFLLDHPMCSDDFTVQRTKLCRSELPANEDRISTFTRSKSINIERYVTNYLTDVLTDVSLERQTPASSGHRFTATTHTQRCK
ncbi:hypothetical protein EVAR_28993_1 [Eumeta japonica]|uniref:Uncharacterized protein n=1 Tax=Eumeta variegata TaxID=151549 RepID=A0A4C1W550_EUMVA|nr:hypothetical protein EVAR_28993_1 [Eumeta japonica]